MTNHECNEECGSNFDGLLTSNDVRTGFISGATFKNKPVRYSVVDELAIFEGCIVLGTVEAMEQQAAAVHAGQEDEQSRGVFIPGANKRWPQGIVPYRSQSSQSGTDR